jgi:hypothetical protein
MEEELGGNQICLDRWLASQAANRKIFRLRSLLQFENHALHLLTLRNRFSLFASIAKAPAPPYGLEPHSPEPFEAYRNRRRVFPDKQVVQEQSRDRVVSHLLIQLDASKNLAICGCF